MGRRRRPKPLRKRASPRTATRMRPNNSRSTTAFGWAITCGESCLRRRPMRRHSLGTLRIIPIRRRPASRIARPESRIGSPGSTAKRKTISNRRWRSFGRVATTTWPSVSAMMRASARCSTSRSLFGPWARLIARYPSSRAQRRGSQTLPMPDRRPMRPCTRRCSN